ncbi:hypothetical protein PTI45_03149 [Paenibacillus nuruki]|uniref:Uncharacterized protein n=1 Tax=Paenibacillus nuruki TaxID=1886670 RepID=A0A1E3L0W5_9BACL|nr:hypothetical protein [Paenibacillus nuruki]ODP27439.1 hypothetical protein PTI45_03149 [Paenibacillus nuruki]
MKITELDIIEITNQKEIGGFVIRRLNSEEFSVYVNGKVECTGNDEDVLHYINEHSSHRSMTVADLIEQLNKVEDKSLIVEVSTGDESKGRFYGGLYRISEKEDYKGKRILLRGKLEEEQ